MTGRLVALIFAAAIGASHALAGDTVSVTITATVLPVCKFFSLSSQRDRAPADAAIRYSCTNGTSPSFAVPPEATATCFACEGPVAMSRPVPPFNVVARGFGSEHNQPEIAIERLIGTAYSDGRALGPGAMTITVAP
jgi:hypothetical protein